MSDRPSRSPARPSRRAATQGPGPVRDSCRNIDSCHRTTGILRANGGVACTLQLLPSTTHGGKPRNDEPFVECLRVSPSHDRRSLRRSSVYPDGRPESAAIMTRFSLRSASTRSLPVLRRVRFQPRTRFQGCPSRRASARPIAMRRRFQSMKTYGLAEAALPIFKRATSFVPSLRRPTRDDFRTRTWRRTIRPPGPTSYFRSRCSA